MILQVQIPEGLQAHFSQLRILKGLRARRCETEGGREAERHDVRVTRFRKALGGLCTSCYLAGDCVKGENWLPTKKRATPPIERRGNGDRTEKRTPPRAYPPRAPPRGAPGFP